jgi:large subunit ribosomal protein L24
MKRLQVGDEVVVIRGNDKGKRGKIARVLPGKGKVVVEGVNQVKRHIRATPQRPGGILEVEAPIHASKVMPVDPVSGKPSRVRFKVEEGQKLRIAARENGGTIVRERG